MHFASLPDEGEAWLDTMHWLCTVERSAASALLALCMLIQLAHHAIDARPPLLSRSPSTLHSLRMDPPDSASSHLMISSEFSSAEAAPAADHDSCRCINARVMDAPTATTTSLSLKRLYHLARRTQLRMNHGLVLE